MHTDHDPRAMVEHHKGHVLPSTCPHPSTSTRQFPSQGFEGECCDVCHRLIEETDTLIVPFEFTLDEVERARLEAEFGCSFEV